MLQIDCPWCGRRDQTEFSYGGEAHVARPADPLAQSDADWGRYLFFRANPKGFHHERWMHVQGCRRWFNLMRHTVSNEIAGAYRPGEQAPRTSDGDRER